MGPTRVGRAHARSGNLWIAMRGCMIHLRASPVEDPVDHRPRLIHRNGRHPAQGRHFAGHDVYNRPGSAGWNRAAGAPERRNAPGADPAVSTDLGPDDAQDAAASGIGVRSRRKGASRWLTGEALLQEPDRLGPGVGAGAGWPPGCPSVLNRTPGPGITRSMWSSRTAAARWMACLRRWRWRNGCCGRARSSRASAISPSGPHGQDRSSPSRPAAPHRRSVRTGSWRPRASLCRPPRAPPQHQAQLDRLGVRDPTFDLGRADIRQERQPRAVERP